MTTDDFTEAARAEAWHRHPDPVDVETGEPVDDWGFEESARRDFLAGAKWARAHLAAQEPTDADRRFGPRATAVIREWTGAHPGEDREPSVAEVEAAAREMASAAAGIVAAGPKPWEWWTDRNQARFRKTARAALSAAREARP